MNDNNRIKMTDKYHYTYIYMYIYILNFRVFVTKKASGAIALMKRIHI